MGERGRLCFGGYLCTPKVPYSCCRGERWHGERWRGPARGGTDSPAGHSSTAPPKYLPQTSCHFAPRAPSCPRRSRAWQNRHPGKFEPAKMATPQKTRGIKHHPPLSDSDRGGLVLDTFGICLWREQGRRAAPREKSVGRCTRKWGVEERKDGVDVELRDFV